MKQTACDLHTHSTFSDGTATPEELVLEAKRIGLGAIALTDHNTLDGLHEFLAAGKKYGIETIPGIEISCSFEGDELHILALFISPDSSTRISVMMKEAQKRKEESNLRLYDALRKAGYAISYDNLLHKSEGYVNRSHFAEALYELGVVANNDEAFATLLRDGGGFYNHPWRVSAEEVLQAIRAENAVSVWAHPFYQRERSAVESHLATLVRYGLQAMEVRYTEYDADTTEYASRLAEQYGLCPSGGSDYHGRRKPGISLGIGRGNLFIPYEWKTRLEEMVR